MNQREHIAWLNQQLEHWRNRALVAESELQQRLVDEQRYDELMERIEALKQQRKRPPLRSY